MKICFYREFVFNTTGGCASSINRNGERPHQTINNMVRIQFFSRVQFHSIWLFYWQYTILIISRLINSHLGKSELLSGINTIISLTLSPLQTFSSGGKKFISSTPNKVKSHWTHTLTQILVPSPLP